MCLSWVSIKTGHEGVTEMAIDDDDDDEKKCDSSEAVLHEFLYRLKNYFLENQRALRVPCFWWKKF